MAHSRARLRSLVSRYSSRKTFGDRRATRVRLQYELLEPRHLLAAEIGLTPAGITGQQNVSAAPITWFETISGAERVPLKSLASVDRLLPDGVAGPIPMAAGEWIVQLGDEAAVSVRKLADADALLDDLNNNFTIISGLGSRGALLLRADGPSRSDIETSLRTNPHVQSYQLNQLIQGQATTPNESDFAAGLLPGLTKINAEAAWDESIGSMSTVVGVVDTGIDSTHPDLYLNIWFNQGELPPKFLDDDGPKLTDIDGDGLITFYDLNNVTRAAAAPYSITVGDFASGLNALFVRDLNGNSRIDAQDILADPNWADGRDTDNNGFFDDFFGVNFRVGAGDPFASNNPSDPLGHGTHVSGTIGAIGGNDTGVVGVNWQTSLMSLRILDNNNQGDSGAAIRAVNYAREMRERYRVDTTGRVTQGANVRVLNNSWGQPGGYEASLEAAIRDSTDIGILFVAAAGNGNILGQGVDNDGTPFYPASYDVPGVIAVAASDNTDRPANFSNYGAQSVDLFSPGIGIRSTLPGGGYGSANGTSMATPHVAGTAALIWAAFPEATVAEVSKAILDNVDPVINGNLFVSAAGRLSASKAIGADVFAPAARLIAKQDVTEAGGTGTEFTVEFSHRSGIDTATIGNDDLVVTRQWGPADKISATLKPNSITTSAKSATATYVLTAPGGTWDALDFGDYVISTVAGKVTSLLGNKTTEARDISLFNVRINDPSVLYVSTFADSLQPGTLRSQIIAANAVSPTPRTIILESGKYTIDLAAVVDPAATFGTSLVSLGIANPGGWTNAATGDFDIQGNITIVGDINDETIIDAQGLDRAFKVHANSTFTLSRLTVQGGLSPATQGGGGILSIGNLNLDQTILKKNAALGVDAASPIYGGAIASWTGNTSINQSWITENQSDFGGGYYYGGAATAAVQRSTLDNNKGGGIYSTSSSDSTVENSTFSANIGGYGAIATGILNGFLEANDDSDFSRLSADGRYVAFHSFATNLVPGDTNEAVDIFVYDRSTRLLERISLNDAGVQANGGSIFPSLSADGRYVTFQSSASNLVPDDTNGVADIFVYDRSTKLIERVNVNDAGDQAVFPSENPLSGSPSMSADGRFVAFRSNANNLVPGITNLATDIYVYDRTTKLIERVSVNDAGVKGDFFSESPSLSADGRYVTFESEARNLVPGDTNNRSDIFVYDRTTKLIERVSVSDAGVQGNDLSGDPSLSADGRYVTFESIASNLVAGDTNGRKDIFVFDRTTKLIERVSLSEAGVQANDFSVSPSISDDGRYVTFATNASNLVPGDTNGTGDIFVFDRTTKLLEHISVSDAGVQGNRDCDNPSLSADGRYVTFSSFARNLVQGDTSNSFDIFVYDRTTKSIQPITYRTITSVIDVVSSTIAFTSGATGNAAIKGDVTVNNSLFVANEVLLDIASRLTPASSYNNTFSDTPQSSLVSPLQRSGTLPPVHQLIAGNPAINQSDPARNGTRDQLGTLRVLADIGAVEATTATVGGKIYVDANRNGQFDTGEQGIPDVMVSITGAADLVIASQSDNTQTPLVNESGVLDMTELAVGAYKFDAQVIPGWSTYTPPLEIIRNQSLSGNGNSEHPSLSANGRYVTFHSSASNLVPGDPDGLTDIFVYDRSTKLIERVSVSDGGIQEFSFSESPSISGDGRYVTFASYTVNLVHGNTIQFIDIYDRTSKLRERVSSDDTYVPPTFSADGRYVAFVSYGSNLESQIFLYDRTTKLTEQVSVSDTGVQADDVSYFPSLSADGRFVTFVSRARNLVPGEPNFKDHIFVYDRTTKLIERVSVSDAGMQANGDSYQPLLSADGRYVTFGSAASNLVPGDTNATGDIFVYDRTTKLIERVSVSDTGVEGNGGSLFPSLSGDGRFVTFGSSASNLVPGDTNGASDIFVYDRSTKLIKRISVSDDGAQGSGASDAPSLSADGRLVTFQSDADNLISGDNNGQKDVFIVPNPFADFRLTLNLQAGDVVTDLNLGLVPNPGTISGRAFEDTIANGVFDIGEPTIANAVVFLDLDGDGLRGADEATVITNADGIYQFLNIDSYRSYSIVVQVPIGFEQVAPMASDNFAWNIFLPAGGTVTDRDFAIRRVQATGQSSASAVSGRLFEDRNGSKVFDTGDVPIVGREVYLDATNFGVRDTNEPVEVTDANGFYSFTGLSPRNVAVTPRLDETLISTSPLGSSFSLQKYPLFSVLTPFGNPQGIAADDLNGDGFQDVAVALGEGNKLSIRLNDKAGGMLAEEIDIDLGSGGAGPTSLVIGQFDGDTKLDVALTANYTGNVTVLLNFDPLSKSFASRSYVKVGNEPLDIASGQLAGDSKPDLVVVNKADKTVQVLTNDGSGTFTAGTAIPTGGKNPSSLVVGNFTGDASLDVATVHTTPSTTTTPFGNVTLFAGDGSGGLTRQTSYDVGALPIDSVTADFNGDGRSDIAVANFNSNSISILIGQSDGTLRVQTAILGTASGAFDIAVGDIDNDGDIDVIASNLTDRNISIFRNIGADSITGDVRFEPLENIGLGQFSLAQRMPLVVGNFDNDTSGSGGTGTIDIVTIPQRTDTLHVLKNTLVNGAHRVALTGLNTITGRDFIIKPAILSPSFDAITNPLPVFEDTAQQLVAISGITKGRATGPQLQFSATSSNTNLITNPTVLYSGGNDATLRFTPLADMSGTAIITVRAVDAGSDATFGGDDDGIFERSFTITVLAVNDPPSFNLPTEISYTQKAGTQTITNFVTGVSRGGGSDENSQTLSGFTVSSDSNFFTAPPAIDAAGTLSFSPSPNRSGAVSIAVTLSDNGGRDRGGVDSVTKTFLLNVFPVNDPPTINLVGDQSVRADAGLQTIASFATGFQPAVVTTKRTKLYQTSLLHLIRQAYSSALPSISTSGVLTYAPAIDRTGVATVSVQVRDSGGRSNSGNDLSTIQSFTITVNPIPDTLRPTPVITPRIATVTNVSSFDIEIDFQEPVTGFTSDDVTLSSGTLSAFEDLTGGKFRFKFSGSDGDVTFGIAPNVAADLAGNTNFAALPVVRTIDSARSQPLLNSSVPNLSNSSSFVAAIDFEKQVVGFTQSSMFVVGGSLSEFTVFDDASGKFSVRVTPSVDGVVTLLLPANAATDLVGNGNLAAAPLVRTIDRVAPVLTLSSTQSSPSLNTTFEVIVQSTKAITGLSAASFNVSGGSIGEPVSLGSERYSVMVTAAGGMFELSVNPGAVADSAGNVNAGSNVLQIDVTPRSPILAPKVNGEAIDLTSMSDTELLDVETIDLRGFGDNVLTLDSDKIRTLFADASATIYADPGDTIAFDGDWQFDGIELVDGAIHRIFTNSGATIFVNGPLDYTNPQNRFDVDASGEVVALDGLLVLTTIRNKRLASANGSFLPMTTENQSQYRFVDVNQDGLVTPLDALLVLNEIRRQNREGSGASGEQVVVAPMQTAPSIATANSMSSTMTVERDATTPELVTTADASQNPEDPISYRRQQWRVDTIQASDDKQDEQNNLVSLIDEAFADPLLLK